MPGLPNFSNCTLTAWHLQGTADPTPVNFLYDGHLEDHNLQVRTLQLGPESDCFLITTVDDYKDYQGSTKIDNRVVIWPDLNDPRRHIVTHGGLATWSPKRLVATWDPNTKDSKFKGVCMIWDLREKKLTKRKVWQDSSPTNLLALQDSDQDVVHWCKFVNCSDPSEVRLVASLSQNTIRIVVWDVVGSTKIHVMETGMKVTPHVVSITENGLWVTLFAPELQSGTMWNMYYGVQVLQLPLPQELVDTKDLFSLSFAPNGSRMATVSAGKIIVWNIGILMPRSMSGTPFLMRHGQDSNAQRRQCKISYSGDAVAILLFLSEADLSTIHVWNVRHSIEWLLPPAGNTSIRRRGISAFALSFDGSKLAACFETESVIIWDLKNDGQGEEYFSTRTAHNTADKNATACLDCTFLSPRSPSSPDVLVVCMADGYIHWLGKCIKEMSNGGLDTAVISCTFSACGGFASILRNDMRTVTHWDLVRRCNISCKKKANMSYHVWDLHCEHPPKTHIFLHQCLCRTLLSAKFHDIALLTDFTSR